MYNIAEKMMNDKNIPLPQPPGPLQGANPNTDLRFKELGNNLCIFLNQAIANVESPRKLKVLLNFLGISRPFCELKYRKVYEFPCDKQSQGRLNDSWIMQNVKSIFKRWQTRWVVLGSTNLFYYDTPEDDGKKMRDSIPFDSDTIVNVIDVSSKDLTLEFTLSRRILRLRIEDNLAGVIALHYIAKTFKVNHYAMPQRFGSFAPIRQNNDCVFFHDGADYFKNMFEHIESAKESIYITDWWFSPELPIMRPIANILDNESSRIDFTLQRAAKRGVRVYVIVYKEFAASMSNDSEHVKKTLEALSPNIKVLRHPNVIISLWSHHEKSCVVDRQTVFMGGLDLCWGRWDRSDHPLFNDAFDTHYPCADYYNPLKKDIVQGRQYQKSMIDRNYPRMPWHDIAVMLKGRVANDFATHFNTYWNHARETNSESEVLFAKQVNPVHEIDAIRSLDAAPEKPEEEKPEGADPYESNPNATSINLQKIVRASAIRDENSILEPQMKIFGIISNESSTEKGQYKVDFLKAVKEEMDRQLILSENERSKSGQPPPSGPSVEQYIGVVDVIKSSGIFTVMMQKPVGVGMMGPGGGNYGQPPPGSFQGPQMGGGFQGGGFQGGPGFQQSNFGPLLPPAEMPPNFEPQNDYEDFGPNAQYTHVGQWGQPQEPFHHGHGPHHIRGGGGDFHQPHTSFAQTPVSVGPSSGGSMKLVSNNAEDDQFSSQQGPQRISASGMESITSGPKRIFGGDIMESLENRKLSIT